MTYHHGVKVIEVNEGARPLTTISTSVIGLVATADDADAAAFPLNIPVEVSNIDAAIGKAGITGTLAMALRAILDQTRTIVHVIRVDADAAAAVQTANVIGTTNAQGMRTGIQALLSCQSVIGYRPRILGAPGLDSQAVAAALASVAAKLGAMAYCAAVGANNGAVIGYRANFSQRELMLITPDVKAVNDAGATVTASSVARALGLRAKIDQKVGWHKTISNVGIDGVLGLTRPVEFDLQSMDNDAGILNAADITTIIRRDGFRFWGSRTCSDEPLFAFESAVRTAHVLRETIAEGLMWAIDKPLTPGLVKDILSTINHKFSVMQSQGYILGARAWFDPNKNPSSTLASGILDLDYDYTPIPPLENINLRQRITDSYFADFSQKLAA
jgi:uncharacterized protein